MHLGLFLNTVKHCIVKRVQCCSFPGEIVKNSDVTFYSQQSHLSCCQGRVLAASMRGRDFTLKGSLCYDHDWHWLLLASAHRADTATPMLDYTNPEVITFMIISTQTHAHTYRVHTGWGADSRVYSEHQYCGTVCYSYRTRDSHSVEIQATKTHLFSADCTQTILFISCVCVCARERKSAFWKIDLMLIVKVK